MNVKSLIDNLRTFEANAAQMQATAAHQQRWAAKMIQELEGPVKVKSKKALADDEARRQIGINLRKRMLAKQKRLQNLKH